MVECWVARSAERMDHWRAVMLVAWKDCQSAVRWAELMVAMLVEWMGARSVAQWEH